MKMKRVNAGSYYAVLPDGTGVRMEKENGTRWVMRLVGFPASFDTVHRTLKHARYALKELLAGRSDIIMEEAR